MSTSRKIITVFGATGNQGGSVSKVFFDDPSLHSKYNIRAVTRDPTKDSAKALAEKGAELVKADLDDQESLKKAFAGSYGVFAVTNFWEHGLKQKEIQQGKNVVDAAKAAGVKHLVWSSLPSATEVTEGRITRVQHFYAKNDVEKYAEKVKGDEIIVSYLWTGLFASNFKEGTLINRREGKVYFDLPLPASVYCPIYSAADDTGKFAWGLLEGGFAANGIRAQSVSEWIKAEEVFATINKHSSEKMDWSPIPEEEFFNRKFVPLAEEETQEPFGLDQAEVWTYGGEYETFGKGSREKQAENGDRWLLNGTKTISWDQYVKENSPLF